MDDAIEKLERKTYHLANNIGKGLLAGIAGTLAITISQGIEMKITGRKPSQAPAKGAMKTFDIHPENKKQKEELSQVVHWGYGTSWGLARTVMGEAGITGIPATAIHFGAILATAMVMPPTIKISPPVTEWKPKDIAVDALHHLVYAAVAGLVYDAIGSEEGNS